MQGYPGVIPAHSSCCRAFTYKNLLGDPHTSLIRNRVHNFIAKNLLLTFRYTADVFDVLCCIFATQSVHVNIRHENAYTLHISSFIQVIWQLIQLTQYSKPCLSALNERSALQITVRSLAVFDDL